MVRIMEKEILIEFVRWLRKEYGVEEVFEMYVDEFLIDKLMTEYNLSTDINHGRDLC